MDTQDKEGNKISILSFRDIPIRVKVGFWATFISAILDKLLGVLPMKDIVLPPVALDILFYGLLALLAFGLVMLALGLIEWARKTRSQKQIIIGLLRREHTEAIMPESLAKLKTTGTLDDISSEEANLILAMSIELESRHGYNDITGLFADRASGVPLNELKTRPCSQCGIPRNQKGKHGE
jgi:hypothetical protein